MRAVNPSKKQAIKPLYHISFIVIITAIFIALNKFKFVNEDTQISPTLEWLVAFVISGRSVWIMLFVIILLVALYAKFRNKSEYSIYFKKASFWFSAFWAGKFYTWGGFFMGWGIASEFVEFIKPYPGSFLIGLASVVVGWAGWYLIRSFSGSFWRRYSSPKKDKNGHGQNNDKEAEGQG